jgi:hypothetical protein
VLTKRIHTLKRTVWSATAIDGEDGEKFADSGEVLREEFLKLGRFQAPLDASFRTHALRVEAHLQVLRTGAGAAPVVGSFLDSGDQ